jgi:glucose-1-phosphate thymidylyltransferase
MKGIILAGGNGTRLYPMTKAVSKQLLPIYDKPMIYYPLSVLLLAGIKDILIISTPSDIENYRKLLGDGHRLGVSFYYKIQEKPRGLAESFILGEEFIGYENVCLILGDNIFYGQDFSTMLNKAKNLKEGAVIFGYPVNNPTEFGVVEFDQNRKVISLEEKPRQPKSNFAVPGLYFYDNDVVNIAKKIKPSSRGELEITDLNRIYLEAGNISVVTLGRGFAWLDTGTVDALSDATEFVKVMETRQGIKIAALEEIAYINGWISKEKLTECAARYGKSAYGKHLVSVAEGRIKY